MQEAIWNSELIILPGVGYTPQLQAPKRIIEIIRSRSAVREER